MQRKANGELSNAMRVIDHIKLAPGIDVEVINLQEPCVLYIGRAYGHSPDVAFFLYIFSTTISTEYFKHAAHSPVFLFEMPFIS